MSVYYVILNSMVTPEAPVVNRVRAVGSQLTKGDTVLFLSPFDHLLSLYVNPEHYCGHFELLVNLVTYPLVQTVIECIKRTSQVLVVYDDASEIPCPKSWRGKYYDLRSCGAKAALKANAQLIIQALGGDLMLVKKIGALSFYRHARPRL